MRAISGDSILSDLRQAVGQASRIERGFFFCVFSLLLPFPVTCAVLPAFAGWVLANREARTAAVRQPEARLLAALVLLALVTPLCYRRFYGFAAGVGLALLLICYLFARSVIASARRPAELFGRALDLCCLVSFCCFFIGIAQKLVFGPRFRATAGLLNANYYGCVIEFVLLACIYRLYTNPHRRRFYILTLSVNAAAVFLCDCQSVWLAVVGGVLTALLVNGDRRRALIFWGGSLAVIAAVVAIPGALPRLERLPATFATRRDIWLTAWRGFLESPLFGRGLLAYLDVGERLGGYRTYHAHSLYLDPLLSLGLVGTALAVCYAALCLRRITAGYRGGFRREAALLASVLAAVAIHGITDLPILWVQTGGFLLLTLAGSAVWEGGEDPGGG